VYNIDISMTLSTLSIVFGSWSAGRDLWSMDLIAFSMAPKEEQHGLRNRCVLYRVEVEYAGKKGGGRN